MGKVPSQSKQERVIPWIKLSMGRPVGKEDVQVCMWCMSACVCAH